ncbi:TIGR00730 family Rossman fold protein [Tardiphaga sp.]|uniref:LOG family protein n=1 Tax=Tardiphaga sp. TaxID=1926292 RepID=UPI002617F50A|nr:TIGR00730 family Rossman fold protein [Tardiphaga sp.]MDB5618077.1 family Rossman fold protein [Tardiphaga sp.]
MHQRSINSVAVFCGSNFGASEAYADGARQLGTELARAGITLVYGGTTKGLMGIVADSVLNNGGSAHGVITERLHLRGHSHAGLTRSEMVTTLRNRKERMTELADAFIAMPGGIGTMEEMMEVWTMNQLSEIDKPVGLLDIDGFFAPFLTFIDHMVETKFLPPAHRHSICVDPNAAPLLDQLRAYQRSDVPKWL